jgi:sugar lactone lactonase YvrE
MPVTVEALITKTGNATGEGPHWDERTQTFLYVDIHAHEVHRWSADTRIDEKYTFGNVNMFIFYIITVLEC